MIDGSAQCQLLVAASTLSGRKCAHRAFQIAHSCFFRIRQRNSIFGRLATSGQSHVHVLANGFRAGRCPGIDLVKTSKQFRTDGTLDSNPQNQAISLRETI